MLRFSNSSLAIRPAKPADLAFLQQVEARAFQCDRISRRSFGRLVRSPSAIALLCERKGLPAGYAVVLFRSKSRTARLYSIAVLPECAGEGVGTALLGAAESLASERGAGEMRLEVRPDNARAIRLYADSGYRLTGTEAGYYADGAEAFRLAKSLQTSAALPVPRRPVRPAVSGAAYA